MSITLKKRILTALILLPVIILALFLPTVWLWRLVVTSFIAIAWWEWIRLSKAGDQTLHIVLASIALIGLSVLFNNLDYSAGVTGFSVLLWVGAIITCFLVPMGGSVKIVPQTKLLFGAWVLAFSWWALIWLREQPAGSFWVLGFLVIIWLADTGAYFTGKKFGKHKLAASISPGKTIEGLIGGSVCVALYGLLVPGQFVDYSSLLLALLAVIIAVVSVGGDLFESWLKRQANMKDSSQVLPGHGGVLDRIDSLIATLPIIVMVYQLIV